ncbi:MAG: hypothetical protein HWD58_05515 [Bacteroidota bacterium]|nr:MAG: hypothetical protein HWD58_05515 [Bacteroidota bacterium]
MANASDIIDTEKARRAEALLTAIRTAPKYLTHRHQARKIQLRKWPAQRLKNLFRWW